MSTATVHVAVFDTLADWEIGYASAHTSNAAEYLSFSGYAGADRYVAEPTVTDGELITASSTAPVHFARAIFARLGLYEPGVAASWFKLYGDRDPAGFYELMSA